MPTFPTIPKLLKSILLASTCLAPVLAQSPAIAQSDPMEEIVVTGIRRSLDLAADIKRDSNAVVDAITAQDIGLFSDNNIGEALARVPGILLEREAGEGYRISIRGLGPRFVRTTINGRTALSSSGGETGNGDDARGFNPRARRPGKSKVVLAAWSILRPTGRWISDPKGTTFTCPALYGEPITI